MNQPRARARPAESPGLPARRAAVGLVAGVLDRGAMLGDPDGLDPAQRAEARGIADSVLRRLGQIDALIAAMVDRAPPAAGLHILRVMTAELVFAGTPPHAAVDLAVRLARAEKATARLAGLVNAVGRRMAREGAARAGGQDAASLALPAWLSARLTEDWGEAAARAIGAAHLSAPPADLTLRMPGDAGPLAAETGGRLLPGGSLRLPTRTQISAVPGFDAGAWWVQDAAAALPARLLPTGGRVLDLCAAPGGKTLQLAAAGAEVWALDRSGPRMRRLEENLARTGLGARAIVADALAWSPEAPFDAILLDAPCSATGTIRRHPDLPHRFDPADLAKLTALQERLLDRAVEWLAPGGTLVFATCSLLRAEGEAQADAILARQTGITVEPISAADEIPAPFVDAHGRLRTRPDQWPDEGGVDGFFAARFRKAA